MTDIDILALDDVGTEARPFPVSPDAQGEVRFTLACLAGADTVHFAVGRGDEIDLRCEVPASGNEEVDIVLRPAECGRYTLDAGTHLPLILPGDARNAPLPPIPAPVADQPWDIALVIDGTARIPGEPPPEGGEPSRAAQLLADRERMRQIASDVDALVRHLHDASPAETRIALLAFGDDDLPGISDAGLRPRYRLREALATASRTFTPYDRAGLEAAVCALPPSPGADFTDALGDALHACTELHWRRRGARKLVVVYGDSPGHSLRRPAPPGGDARAREHDVDIEARHLHAQGVEILTVYSGEPIQAMVPDDLIGEQRRRLLQHASDQYLHLASEPRLAVTAERFQPQSLAKVLLARDYRLGRDASYGRFRPSEADPCAHA
jgi:hypothetical protein